MDANPGDDELFEEDALAEALVDAGGVTYDLDEWSDDEVVEAAARLADAGVPAAFEPDGDLVVPASHEAVADDVLDSVRLPGGGPAELVYELDGWGPAARADLDAALWRAQVRHRWQDDGDLVVEEVDQELVDGVVAEILAQRS